MWFLGVWWHLAVCGLICHQKGAALLSTFHWFSLGWWGIDFRMKDSINMPTDALVSVYDFFIIDYNIQEEKNYI